MRRAISSLWIASLLLISSCGGGGGDHGGGHGGGGGTPVAITVSTPSGQVFVPPGGTLQITATVTNADNASVTWSESESGATCAPACGTLNNAGNASINPVTYTAPNTVPAQLEVTITTISVQDSTKSAAVISFIGTQNYGFEDESRPSGLTPSVPFGPTTYNFPANAPAPGRGTLDTAGAKLAYLVSPTKLVYLNTGALNPRVVIVNR